MPTSYKILLFLHILSVVIAFAPASVHPFLGRQFATERPLLQRFTGFAAKNDRRIYAPALIAAGLFGILILATQKGDAYSFDQPWVSMALLVWIAMNGVLHAMILPGERKVAAGEMEAIKRVDLGGMIISLLFLVMLFLMIWRPGQ